MSTKILIVDDEKAILDSLYRFFKRRKWNALKANSGQEGIDILKDESIDIIVSDMRMPEMDGATFLTKAKEISPTSIRILLTGYADMEAVIHAVNEAKIYNYLNKPWDDQILESVIHSAIDFKEKEDERLRLIDEIAKKNDELNTLNTSLEEKVKIRTEKLQVAIQKAQAANQKVSKNFREALSLISSVIEMQDGSESNCTEIITEASISLAKELELSPIEVEQVRIAAQLHNIGKLSLPESIRQKPINKLNRAELDIYQTHPIQGEAILSGMTGLKTVSKIIRSHQEYLYGQGFPDKLSGDGIPIGSKIICITSDFQKLESNLLIDDISTAEGAIEYIKAQSGKLYDARIVDLFESYFNDNLQHYRSYLSRLSLKDITEGMVLAENLVSSHGLLLLTKGSSITSENIQQLKTYEIDIGGKLIFPILNTSIDKLRDGVEE